MSVLGRYKNKQKKELLEKQHMLLIFSPFHLTLFNLIQPEFDSLQDGL